MLYSTGISIGAYALYKFIQIMYHKYYLKSECHQRTLEISVVNIDEEKKDEEKKETEIEMHKLENTKK